MRIKVRLIHERIVRKIRRNFNRQIGTYELSIAEAEGCTPPRNPKTGVDWERLRRVLEETGLE
jgi:adenylyl- and sulfurtransferase ThiI